MHRAPRIRLLLIAVLIGLISAGIVGTPSAPAWASTSHRHPGQPVPLASMRERLSAAEGQRVFVRLRNKQFDPPVVVIHEGDTVIWVNETKGGWHDVQSFEELFSSPRLRWGEVFMHTFEEPGTFGYFCTPHVIDGMQGVVVVLPEGAPLPDPLPTPAPSPATHPAVAPVPTGAPDTIVTVAGGGGAGGAATDASLYLPEGIALDNRGRLYVADTENCQIRRIDPGGTIVSVLGHESCGASMGGDADLGPWLHTNHPAAVAVGPDGALYVADTINCRIRRLATGGTISTVAGSGSCRASGDGGPATEAGLAPWGIAWRGSKLYVADTFNCRVRMIDEAGAITTVAGNGACGFSGDGGPATEARLFFPRDVAISEDGALYLTDTENCRVRRIDPGTGVIETVAGTGACSASGDGGPAEEAALKPWAVAIDAAGGLLITDRQSCRLRRLAPDGSIDTVAGTGVCASSRDGAPARQTALNSPADLAIGSDGSIYLADAGSCRIRRIDPAGILHTVAGSGVCAPGGDGGAAVAGGLWHPMGLASGPKGEWYFTELDTCRVRRVDASGMVSTYAGTGICGASGDGGPATEALLSDTLGGLALASDGSLFLAEGFHCRVRRIDPAGVIDTYAGSHRCGFSGDGGPARRARLDFVADVAVDAQGDLYIAEPYNCRVRRVEATSGVIQTVAGDGSCTYNGENVPAREAGIDPWGVALGPDGGLYFSDARNCRVRRVYQGKVVTVAGSGTCGYAGDGGPATQAQLLRPYDLELDRAGNLYIADLRTFTVRKVDRRGVITTVAGAGIARPVDVGGYDPTNGALCTLHNLPVPAPTYLGDGGPASDAGLYFPYAIAIGRDGHLYIADTFDHRVRRVTCGGAIPCAGPAVTDAPRTAPPAPAKPPAPVLLPQTGRPAGVDRGWLSEALLAVGGGLLGLASVFRFLANRQRRGGAS